MKTLHCVICDKTKESPSWRHKTWHTSQGEIDGWGCYKHFDDLAPRTGLTIAHRRAIAGYEKDLLQPYRDGEFSKEFRDAHPESAKRMVKDGVITKQQHDNAKEVWKGDL